VVVVVVVMCALHTECLVDQVMDGWMDQWNVDGRCQLNTRRVVAYLFASLEPGRTSYQGTVHNIDTTPLLGPCSVMAALGLIAISNDYICIQPHHACYMNTPSLTWPPYKLRANSL
jgi:hypothetical protein